MGRISILARRQRLKNLEIWAVRAVLAETFFLAIFPSVAAVAVVLGTVVWFLRLQVDAQFKLRSLPFDVPIMLFVLLSAVSVFNSPARNAELVYNFFSLIGIFVMTYLLVGQNIRTVEQVKFFVKALSASALIVVLGGFFQYVFGIDVAEITWIDAEAFPEMRKRVFSTMENPNVLAGFLNVAICIALGLFAKVSDGRIRFLAAASVVMAAACLLMTYSSGGLVTLLVIFGVYGLIADWRILILMAASASFLLYNDAEKILSLFTTTASDDFRPPVRRDRIRRVRGGVPAVQPLRGGGGYSSARAQFVSERGGGNWNSGGAGVLLVLFRHNGDGAGTEFKRAVCEN